MLDNDRIKLAQVNHRGVMASGLRIFIVIMILGLFGVSTAFGDSQYSDTWFDDSQAEEGIGNVVGSGVVDGSYTHDYYIDTTLKSPSSRTESDSSEQTTGYARTDILLQWIPGDAGNYITRSKHWARCPGGIFFAAVGLTTDTTAFNDGGLQTLDYQEVGPISPGSCGYKLCPYEDEKPCYAFLRRNYNHDKKINGSCWRYLRVHYLMVTTIIGSRHCIRYFKEPTDNLTGNPCGV